MVAVDILHEVEIGVWKALFIHLLRVLESIDKSLINVLNSRFVIPPTCALHTPPHSHSVFYSCRFRQVPGFGNDTIRRFGNNVSEMKQFAAREYEDILQVGPQVHHFHAIVIID